MSVFDEQDVHFKVVVNHEKQYSIWPTEISDAPGWRDVGVEGTKDVCFEYISNVWTDMRPRSLREAMGSDSDDV